MNQWKLWLAMRASTFKPALVAEYEDRQEALNTLSRLAPANDDYYHYLEEPDGRIILQNPPQEKNYHSIQRFHGMCPNCHQDVYPGQSTFYTPATDTTTCENCERCVICRKPLIGKYEDPGVNYCWPHAQGDQPACPNSAK